MLLHEHLETGKGHSKHLRKLHRVNGVFLRLEHARFCLFNVFQLINLGIITSHSFVLNFTLSLLVSNISLRELLPGVINLLVDQTVSFLKNLTDLIISSKFNIHLHSDEFLHDCRLAFESINFSSIRVLEVVSSKVHSWALGHQVNYNLNESLLLECVTSVLVALDILEAELQLGFLIQLFPMQHVFEDSESVNVWQNIPQVSVLHWLNLVNVERDNLENLLFDGSHVAKRAVIHEIETVVVCNNIKIIGLIKGDRVDSSHHFLSLSFFGISILGLLKFRRYFLSVNRLSKGCVEFWNDWTCRVDRV